MKLNGEEVIPARREVVWKALNDPAVLKRCIPGCKSITKLSDTDMEAVVTVALGPLKVNFTGKVKLSDLDPPSSYRISGSGNGGFAGSATGGANVKLEAVPEGTILSYAVDLQVTGKLAVDGRAADRTRVAQAGGAVFREIRRDSRRHEVGSTGGCGEGARGGRQKASREETGGEESCQEAGEKGREEGGQEEGPIAGGGRGLGVLPDFRKLAGKIPSRHFTGDRKCFT